MLFGNNMSWLYGKLKKKLDAPATAGSAGDVLTLGESGKPEWGEGGGGGGEAISLYMTNSAPALDDLPPVSDPTKTWDLFGSGPYLSMEAGGTALTYTELTEILDAFNNGAAVTIRNEVDNESGGVEIHSTSIAPLNLIETAQGEDGDGNIVALGIKMMTYSDDLYGDYQVVTRSTQ